MTLSKKLVMKKLRSIMKINLNRKKNKMRTNQKKKKRKSQLRKSNMKFTKQMMMRIMMDLLRRT